MSGIMFNGIEKQMSEDIETYINRAVNEAFKINNIPNIPLGEDEKSKNENPDPRTSSDDDTEEDTDTDTDTDTDEIPLFKRIKLTTDADTPEEHNEAIQRFNELYEINEIGCEGKSGNYYTYGDRDYNIHINYKLTGLYELQKRSIYINSLNVKIEFFNSRDDEHENNLYRNFVSARNDDKYIRLPKNYPLIKFIEKPYIKNKLCHNNNVLIENMDFNEGDVLYYKDPKFNDYMVFYQVLKTTNQKVCVLPLRPILSVVQLYNDTQKHKIFKYRLNDLDYTIKKRYLSKRIFNYRYIMDDYIYMYFNK